MRGAVKSAPSLYLELEAIMSKPVITLLSAAVFAALFPSVALANDDNSIEVIEITSNFRTANLMRVEGSISVIGAEQITAKNAMHIEDVLNGLANVNFAAGASRGRFVQIRGIGLRSQFTDSVDPSVALVIDGINYSGLGGAGIMFDVEQFELYRGPQGTQFGTDALAGVIKMRTTAATSDTKGRVQLSYGNYGTYSAGVALGGALSEDFNIRTSIVNQGSDGYVDNDFLKRDDTNTRDETSAKIKFSWLTTDDLTIDGVVHFVDIDNGYDAFSLDQNGRTLSDEPGRDTQETYAFALTPTYNGFNDVTVSLALSALNSDLEYSYDEDWSYVGIRPDWEYSSTDRYLRDRSQLSADLRLVSKGHTLFNQSTSWVGGLYFNQRDVDLTRQYTSLATDFLSNNEHRDIAAYGQFAIDLSPQTEFIIGARFGRYDIDYRDSSLIAADISDNLYGLHASLNHQLNEQALVYLSASRSDKAGGINGQALAKVDDLNDPAAKAQLLNNTAFDPETLYSLEYGVKGHSSDDALNIKLAAFYNYRQDPQLKGWIVETNEDQGDTFTEYLDNAGSGRVYGLEIETNYQLNTNVELVANVGYLRTKIKDYVVLTNDLDMNNRAMAHAPKYQFSIGANYVADNGFYASVDLSGKDSFYFSDGHNEQSKSYVVTNLNLGYQAQAWRVNLWARNVFDKEYSTRGFYFGNDPRDEYLAHNYVQHGEPRVFGLAFESEF